ncbi:MAG: EamA family transporter RarD [Opitutus sp.]|nr:EamA family transporter RarD [Opitutus sp.]
MAPSAASSARTGALAAALCYFLWGLVPLYWKQLGGINALELIAHRCAWSLLFVLVLVHAQGGFSAVLDALRTKRSFAINLASSVLLTTNWLGYVWGVNHGLVVECSLGYFLVPLVNVAAGRFVLQEHLRRVQWIAIACAALGVAVMIAQLGRPPWLALFLAVTWGGYGLMRKQSHLGSLTGLTVETLLLTPLALAFLFWQHHTGEGALGRVDTRTHLLLLSAGIITATPLLLFAYGAQRIRMATMGLLQFIAPTVQLIIAVWVYHEPFARSRALGFVCIWVGLALYATDNVIAYRRTTA